MSKELTPLEALNNLIEGLEDEHLGLSESDWVVESKEIIEIALKEYEGAKNHIKALNEEIIENSLKIKALEIIKRVDFDIIVWKHETTQGTRYYYLGKPITQEEYDLLKEILK